MTDQNNPSVITPFMPPWMPFAIKEIGVKEIPGNQDNPRIIEYHKTTSLKAEEDEIPWCMAFVNWCLIQAGLKGTGLPNARSALGIGCPISLPCYGAITILKRGNSAWQGHVGFLVYEGASQVMILGGNQGDKVSIAPFKKSDVLAYRWF